MRILFHHRFPLNGAQFLQTNQVINGFREAGHTVDLLHYTDIMSKLRSILQIRKNNERIATRARHSGDSYYKEMKKIGLPKSSYDILLYAYNILSYSRVLTALTRKSYDIYYDHYTLYSVGGVHAANLIGIPVVLEVGMPGAHMRMNDLSFPKLAVRMELNAFRKADLIFTITSALRDWLIQAGFEGDKIYAMSNAVDLSIFRKDIDGHQIRVKHNIDDKIVVGFVGTVYEQRGLQLALQAINKLKVDIPNIHLMLIGEGPFLPELKTLAEKMELENHVCFVGRIPFGDVPVYIAAMDIAIIADSNWWGSPMKLFEYMSMSKPVVGVDLYAVTEILQDGINGLVFKRGDLNDFCVKIRLLALDEKLRTELGQNGRKIVEINNTWAHHGYRLLELCKKHRLI